MDPAVDGLANVIASRRRGRRRLGGANTLYMDGHVQSNRYPSEFPATTTFAQLASFF